MQAPFADPLPGILLDQARTQRLLLVGRTWEMQMASSLLETVAFDRPAGARALMISGEIGIGKSRLLAEMQEKARERTFQVLHGFVHEPGNTLPYLPFIEALRPAIRSTPLEALRGYLGFAAEYQQKAGAGEETSASDSITLSLSGAPMVAALARLFPELPGMLRITIQPEALSQDQEKFRLFDSIATLLERMATDQPVLLSIDNLQWADSASLELTMYLTVRLRQGRVALVGATRPPGSGAPQSDGAAAVLAIRTLGELVRQGLLILLPLGPLSSAEMELYLHELLPGELPASIASALHVRAEGNPFFLEELVRMLTMRGQLYLLDGHWSVSRPIGSALPESISQAVEQRLQGLSLTCLECLRCASLFGRAFPLTALATVLGRSEADAQSFIDEAVKAGVLAPTSIRAALQADYVFSQGIIQEVLSRQVPPYRARELHAGIGEALEAYYGAQAQASELAHHYTLGNLRGPALRWSILAGQDAMGKQAYREAIGHFRAALQFFDGHSDFSSIPNPAQLHVWVGQCWFKTGDLKQAMEAFQQALEGQRRQVLSQQDGLQLAQINRHISDIYRMQGQYEQALGHLHAARDALEQIPTREGVKPDQPVIERILQLQAQATLDLFLAQPASAEEALWQSHRLAAGIGDRESQAFALHLIGWIRGWSVHIHEAIRYQEQSYALYAELGDPFRAALVDQGLGIIYLAIGEIEQARLHTMRGIERARRYGVRFALGWLYNNQAITALVEGNWTASESFVEQAMQEAQATENARLKPMVLETYAELRFRQGRWLEAEQHFQSAIQAAINTEWYPSAMALYGHFLAVTGRSQEAKAQLDRASALPEPSGYSGHFYIPFLAEGYLHLGRSAQASTYIERIHDLRGFMYYGVAVDRILGQVAVLEGELDTAELAFADALALCRKVHNQPEEAATLYEQARATLHLTHSGLTAASRERIDQLCEQARNLFRRHQMERSVDMVNTLLEGLQQLSLPERVAPAQKQVTVSASSASPHGYHLDLQLTRREQEVLRLVAEGYTDREVADMLVISHRTVNRHLSNIFVKLDVPGRAAAVAYAIRQGMVA